MILRSLDVHICELCNFYANFFVGAMTMTKQKKRHAIRAAAGLWADRNDLPNFDDLRSEFERKDYPMFKTVWVPYA